MTTIIEYFVKMHGCPEWKIRKILNTHHKDSTLFYSKVFFTIKYVNGNGLIATHRRKEIFVALWAIQLFSVCMIITFTFFTWRFFLFKNILIRESNKKLINMRFAYPYGNVYFGYLNVIINPVILPVSKLSYLVFHSKTSRKTMFDESRYLISRTSFVLRPTKTMRVIKKEA